jgi:hypothetical protein
VAGSSVVAPINPDPGLPGVRGLFGDAGLGAVARFLERRGWRARESRAAAASYHPGRSALLRYRVRATTPQGEPRTLSLCVESRARPRRRVDPPSEFEGRYRLPDPVEDIDPYLVWAFPYDPSLEGLPEASWGADVREVVGSAGARPLAVSVEPLRYRPRRRAVFRYVAVHRDRGDLRREVSFGKVLPGPKAARWLQGHRGAPRRIRRSPVRLALPVATAGTDTVVVPALPGRSLRALLVGGGSLPSPDRVAALLDDLPQALPQAAVADRTRDPERTARGAADLVARLVPEASRGAGAVADAVARGARANAVPPRPVHGDLYEAQVFVDDDYSLGLIDLDDAGIGDPAMDAANFSAHLLALALAVPPARDRLVAYRNLVRPAFARRLRIDPGELAWREGLAMLQLASGPFRVLHPAWPSEVRQRVDLAVRLIGGER